MQSIGQQFIELNQKYAMMLVDNELKADEINHLKLLLQASEKQCHDLAEFYIDNSYDPNIPPEILSFPPLPLYEESISILKSEMRSRSPRTSEVRNRSRSPRASEVRNRSRSPRASDVRHRSPRISEVRNRSRSLEIRSRKYTFKYLKVGKINGSHTFTINYNHKHDDFIMDKTTRIDMIKTNIHPLVTKYKQELEFLTSGGCKYNMGERICLDKDCLYKHKPGMRTIKFNRHHIVPTYMVYKLKALYKHYKSTLGLRN